MVAALYGFVVTQTRYVGLEFGIHGYKPYRVDQVLERRFGDCKDKASLTHALLEAVGLDSKLVLLRMRRLGRVPERPASLAVFNHAILWVPSLDLWLDGTASYTGTRELPGGGPRRLGAGGRAGRHAALRPHPRRGAGGEPAGEPLRPGALGRRLGAGRSAGRGWPACRPRPTGAPTRARATRRSTLEAAFNRNFPGLAVEQVTLSDLDKLEEDVRMDFVLQVPRWAERDGAGLRFSPFGRGAGYAETWASLAERRHDLVLGSPTVNRFQYRVTLPPGWRAGALPEPATGETPQAAFSVAWRRDGDAVVAEGFVTFRAAVVPAASYPAFRDLMTRLDRALGRTVTAAPAGAAPRPRRASRRSRRRNLAGPRRRAGALMTRRLTPLLAALALLAGCAAGRRRPLRRRAVARRPRGARRLAGARRSGRGRRQARRRRGRRPRRSLGAHGPGAPRPPRAGRRPRGGRALPPGGRRARLAARAGGAAPPGRPLRGLA